MAKEKTKKINPLYDILNFICTKQYTWETLPDIYKTTYSQFMLNRFLSSYDYLLPLLNLLTINKYTDEQHFTCLLAWVKKTKHYFKYDSYKVDNIDNDLIISVKKEYNIGKREALRYIELLSNAQKIEIKNKWADYLKYILN